MAATVYQSFYMPPNTSNIVAFRLYNLLLRGGLVPDEPRIPIAYGEFLDQYLRQTETQIAQSIQTGASGASLQTPRKERVKKSRTSEFFVPENFNNPTHEASSSGQQHHSPEVPVTTLTLTDSAWGVLPPLISDQADPNMFGNETLEISRPLCGRIDRRSCSS
jgi:hypothetical protein